jgi:hypothetical protein
MTVVMDMKEMEHGVINKHTQTRETRFQSIANYLWKDVKIMYNFCRSKERSQQLYLHDQMNIIMHRLKHMLLCTDNTVHCTQDRSTEHRLPMLHTMSMISLPQNKHKSKRAPAVPMHAWSRFNPQNNYTNCIVLCTCSTAIFIFMKAIISSKTTKKPN